MSENKVRGEPTPASLTRVRTGPGVWNFPPCRCTTFSHGRDEASQRGDHHDPTCPQFKADQAYETCSWCGKGVPADEAHTFDAATVYCSEACVDESDEDAKQ